MTSAGAHGTAEKANVSVRYPVTEVGISKVNPEPEGKELKIKEVLNQELSAEDNMKPENFTASEVVEKEDAVDAILEVPRRWMSENPELGCKPIRPISDASGKTNSGNKQMSHGTFPEEAGGAE